MELFLDIFILILLVALSSVVHRFFDFIPVPLIQIVLGIGAALPADGVHLTLEPELFFVLFVAPLLFNDGMRTPRGELWRLRRPILLLALGLVMATVIAGGYAIHWMLPSIPLAASFALAAILSPTDAVAVGGLSSRIRLPLQIKRLLEGEALMNDATGLVAFRFAVAATVTGTFSLPHAAAGFVGIAAGGLVCGALLAVVVICLRLMLRRFGLEDTTVHILIHLLTPFFIFLIAEHAGVSGILAVVAGGIVHAVEKERLDIASGRMQAASESTWTMLLFVLNGLVFLLLGMQLPEIIAGLSQSGDMHAAELAGYVAAITLLLTALRFIWVYGFWSVSGSKRSRARIAYGSLLTSLSGVRGAVTLAGALSLPRALEDGSPFPERELLLFLAAGVILLSLLLASMLLPLLVREKGLTEAERRTRERAAQIRSTEAAIAAIREAHGDSSGSAASVVLADYLRRLQRIRTRRGGEEHGKAFRRKVNRLFLEAVNEERRYTIDAFSEGRIGARLASRLQFWLNQSELACTNRGIYVLRLGVLLFRRLWRQAAGRERSRLNREELLAVRKVKTESARAAIARLEALRNESNDEAVETVLAHYGELLERLGEHEHGGGRREADVSRIHRTAIQAERDAIQRLYENGEINRKIANDLLASVNYREASGYE